MNIYKITKKNSSQVQMTGCLHMRMLRNVSLHVIAISITLSLFGSFIRCFYLAMLFSSFICCFHLAICASMSSCECMLLPCAGLLHSQDGSATYMYVLCNSLLNVGASMLPVSEMYRHSLFIAIITAHCYLSSQCSSTIFAHL